MGGSKHKIGWADDNEYDADAADSQLFEEYAKNSERFKESVESANNQKKQLREEINKLEIEVRKLRDEEADRLTENKNLEYLIH